MSKRGFTVTKAMREEKRHLAEQDAAEYAKLSTEEKLSKLPKEGATRQRKRLLLKLEEEKAPKVKPLKKEEVAVKVVQASLDTESLHQKKTKKK